MINVVKNELSYKVHTVIGEAFSNRKPPAHAGLVPDDVYALTKHRQVIACPEVAAIKRCRSCIFDCLSAVNDAQMP